MNRPRPVMGFVMLVLIVCAVAIAVGAVVLRSFL